MNADQCVSCFDDLPESRGTFNATMDGYLCGECAGAEVETYTVHFTYAVQVKAISANQALQRAGSCIPFDENKSDDWFVSFEGDEWWEIDPV